MVNNSLEGYDPLQTNIQEMMASILARGVDIVDEHMFLFVHPPETVTWYVCM